MHKILPVKANVDYGDNVLYNIGMAEYFSPISEEPKIPQANAPKPIAVSSDYGQINAEAMKELIDDMNNPDCERAILAANALMWTFPSQMM